MSLVKPPVRSALNTLTALTSVLEQDPGLDPAVARAIRDVLADEAAGRPLPPVLEAEYDPVERTVAAFAAGSLSYARDHSDDETFRALTHILLRLALRFPEHARSVMAWSDWDGAAPGEPRVAEAPLAPAPAAAGPATDDAWAAAHALFDDVRPAWERWLDVRREAIPH